jgi:diguanylate cyclase (GGDEF)-like protein
MTSTRASTAQQLAEFLAGVAGASSDTDAVRRAIERIAEVFEAEVCAFVEEGRLVHAIGFGRAVDEVRVVGVTRGECRDVDVPGFGPCAAVVLPVDAELESALLLVRPDDPPTAEEASLARGMAKVFALALRMLRTIERERSLFESLQQRHRLNEHLSKIERSISSRQPLQEILDEVTKAASQLFGDEIVGLRLIDRDDPSYMTMVSSVGVDDDLRSVLHHVPVDRGIGGRAIVEDRLVVEHDYAHAAVAYPQFVKLGLLAGMAAPVHENNVVVGSLTVASRREGRRYSADEQETLVAFADHISLALNDAFAMHQLDQALDDAVHQAMHDALTGLPNRVLLRDRLDHAIKRSRRQSTSIAVAFVDLDDFKLVNDTMGHAAGDALLVATAERLTSSVRPGDTAARLGGDEFAVLFEDINRESEAVLAAERLLPAIARRVDVDGHDVVVTGSVGLALCRPKDNDVDAGELLRRADLAMYRAKSKGKNRVAVFRQEMHQAVADRVSLVAELRRAIERRELTLAYQPIVDLVDGRIVGAEALVRWPHPTRGLLGPSEFVPLAEERDLIGPLGHFVLTEAAQQMARWQALWPGLHLSVNLSPRQLLQRGGVETVLDALAETGYDPGRLTLEITESVLLHDDDLTRARLARLRDLGVRIAIDDFGTGYASLAYLCRFAVDILKIDRTFVGGMHGSGGEHSLVAAIIQLGRSLDLATVAEGVETAAQAETLRALGCTHAQGYHLSPPIPAEALEALLAHGRLPARAIVGVL